MHRRDILSYVEAILRVYNQYGRRDNIYKARIKILVHELGIDKFAQEVEEEWRQIRDGALTLADADDRGYPRAFHLSEIRKTSAYAGRVEAGGADPRFERWRKNSVFTTQGAGLFHRRRFR